MMTSQQIPYGGRPP